MDADHYLAGYDRGDGTLRAELRIPDRYVGAVRALAGYEPGSPVTRHLHPELVPIAAEAAGLVLPASAGELDWFVDIYSREE